MDRYSILKTATQTEWLIDCPIKIEKYNILLDNQTSKNVVQVKFTALSTKAVKSMWIDILCYDDAQDFLLTVSDIAYINVNTKHGDNFGDRQAIPIDSNAVGNIQIVIKKIVFDDETVWRNNSGEIGIKLPEQKSAKDVYGNLYNQFCIEANKLTPHCDKALVSNDTYWQCVCGQANDISAPNCCLCGAKLADLSAISDISYLEEQNNIRIVKEKEEAKIAAEKAEQERIEQEKLAEEKRIQQEKAVAKKKKICIAVAVCLVVGVIGYFVAGNVIKANKYKAAEDMLANKQYDEAITTFAELKDYKDSADMILESKYLQAKDSYNSGFYEAALSEYSELNEYKDSAEMVISSTNQIDYKAAMSSYNDEDYLTAVEGFEKLGDFANSVEMFEKSKEMLYNQAITDLNNNNYENLGARFEFLSQYDYKDSSQKLENIKQTFNRISGVYSGYKDFGYNIRTKLVVAIVAEYDTGKVNFITKTNNDEAISLYYIYNPSTGGTYGSYIQNMYTIYNGYIIDSIYETKLTKGL